MKKITEQQLIQSARRLKTIVREDYEEKGAAGGAVAGGVTGFTANFAAGKAAGAISGSAAGAAISNLIQQRKISGNHYYYY